MNSLEQKKQQRKKALREEFVHPKRAEHPLVMVCEQKESKRFEATFALELTGVLRKEVNHEAFGKENGNIRNGYMSSLLAGMAPEQRVELIYCIDNSKAGGNSFKCRIGTHTLGNTAEAALEKAYEFHQNLEIGLGMIDESYRFSPIKHPQYLNAVTGARKAGIQPSGIIISGAKRKTAGFTEKSMSKSGNVLVAHPAQEKVNYLDAIALGAISCLSNVNVVLSIKPFILSSKELGNIQAALECLRSGVIDNVRYQALGETGVENTGILDGLKHDLELWLKNPYGYRLDCHVLADEAVPSSLLGMLGSEIYNHRPVDITKDSPFDTPDADTLDLRNCFNIASYSPPLFPSTSALMKAGVKRLFACANIDLPDTGLLLGRVGDERRAKDVRFSQTDRSRHCYILGATGAGKSTLLYNMITQDISNGEGVCVVEPHGDLYNQVLGSIPNRRRKDVVLINPCDFDHAVGINFLECNGPYKNAQRNFITNEMIKIFDRLYNMRVAGGPMFEMYMRNAMLLVMDNEFPGGTLMDVVRVFEDSKYRSFLKSKCNNPAIISFWNEQAEKASGEASLSSMAPYITSKLNQFTTNALLRPIIGQTKSTVDFRRIINNRQILLVNLSKGMLGEMDTQLLGMLIIGKIFSAAMGRITIPAEQRHPFFLYVDEFQNFTTDTVAYLMSESRKFGLNLTLANQNMAQLSANEGKQNILDAVLGNVGTMLLFRLGAKDADKLEIYTKPELTAQDLQGLPDFYVAAKLLNGHTPCRPFVFKTHASKDIFNHNARKTIIGYSRMKYTRPTKQVEKEIMRRKSCYVEL